MSSSIHLNLISIINLLERWLAQHVPQPGIAWLTQKREQIAESVHTLPVFLRAFSAVPRYTGKNNLNLAPVDLQAAQAMRTGWLPSYWSVDQVARTLLLLTLPYDDPEKYLHTLEQIFATADAGELVVLYQSLPLLPYPERHCARAAEGLRSNMTIVFNAVALQNPYPGDYFDNSAWNQMILKTVFVNSPLHLILKLDERANPKLAQMLVDYAHERWAAKRTVTPQLWRLVGRFADTVMLADIEKALHDPDLAQQAAAALACAECPLPKAQALLALQPELHSAIDRGILTWSSLTKQPLAV